jgi:hypothetical protein
MAKLLLGEVLRKKGLSKRQFAKQLGERYENVFRYFREGYDPKLSKLVAWAKVLKCRVRDLIKE